MHGDLKGFYVQEHDAETDAEEEDRPITFQARDLGTGTYIIRAQGETFASAAHVLLAK